MLREIKQYDVRSLLYPFEDDVTSIRGYIEVLNIEIGTEVGQLALDAGLKIDEPKILMLNLTAEKYERWSIGQEDEMSGAARQGQGRQRMRCLPGGYRFY